MSTKDILKTLFPFVQDKRFLCGWGIVLYVYFLLMLCLSWGDSLFFVSPLSWRFVGLRIAYPVRYLVILVMFCIGFIFYFGWQMRRSEKKKKHLSSARVLIGVSLVFLIVCAMLGEFFFYLLVHPTTIRAYRYRVLAFALSSAGMLFLLFSPFYYKYPKRVKDGG